MKLFNDFYRLSPFSRPALSSYALFIFAALSLCAASNSYARDMAGRMGIGYNNEVSNRLPAISIKYGLSKDMSVQAIGGISTGAPTEATLGGRFYKNLFFEQNLNFYSSIGFAYAKGSLASGIDLLALLGAEFFIPGLESLGLQFDAGVNANNVNSQFVVTTVGYSFIHAGMHFYF